MTFIGGVGKGLFRLYLALWLVWFSYGVADNYKELATYLGYDRWTIDKASERQKERCDKKSQDIECLYPGMVLSNDVISEERMNVVVWMFKMAMIKAPFFFLIFLVVLYWLGKWVIVGFTKKKDAKT